MTKTEQGCASAALGLLAGFLLPIIWEVLIVFAYLIHLIPPVQNIGIAEFGPFIRILTRLPFTMPLGLVIGVFLPVLRRKIRASKKAKEKGPPIAAP